MVSDKKKFINSRWFTAGGLVAIVVLGTLVLHRWPNIQKTKQEMARIEQELAMVKERQADLDQKKDYFQSDEYIESQARLKLHYKDPDEKVVYVYRSTSQEETVPLAKPPSNLRLWWEYLLGSSD